MSGIEEETLKLLSECVNLIYKAGLFEELSVKTRETIANNETLLKLIAASKPPSLDPRLTIDEYIAHVLKIFSVPSSQQQFYITMVKVVYLMLLAEKNPMVAQQLKGVLALGADLQYLLKV